MNRFSGYLAMSAALLCTLGALSGCAHVASLFGLSGTYSFSGAQIPAEAKTFSIGYFNNNAAMVAPTFSNTLTEAIKDRFTRQTRLTQVTDVAGDLAMEGEITGYVTEPISVSADETALLNRLTATIQVRYTSVYEPEWSFEEGRSFSAYADYDINQQFSAIEEELIRQITEDLVDQVYNATVANW